MELGRRFDVFGEVVAFGFEGLSPSLDVLTDEQNERFAISFIEGHSDADNLRIQGHHQPRTDRDFGVIVDVEDRLERDTAACLGDERGVCEPNYCPQPFHQPEP